MWQLIVGAVVGGLVNGGFQYINSTLKLNEDKKALDSMKNAVNDYTGQNAFNKNVRAGSERGKQMNEMAMASATGQATDASNTAFANAQGLANNDANNNIYGSQYQTGMAQQDMLNKAKLNAEQQRLQNNMDQANKEYGQRTAMFSNGMKTIGDIAGMAGQVGSIGGRSSDNNTQISDESEKESPDEKSELPRASIEDSLRQLKAVWYEYKNADKVPEEDDKTHVGFTAQNAEDTDLFKDCVTEGNDGIKRIDRWRLQESLTAGLSELQKEIDELKSSKSNDDLPIRMTKHLEVSNNDKE